MSELKFESVSQSRNVVGEWAIRIGVAGAFIVFGLEKFPSDSGSMWVDMFHRIGLGDWFRYFTGVVEVLGGLLVLIPRTALIGFTILAVTMAGAVIIVAFVLGHPEDSIFPGVFTLALIGCVVWSRGNR
jgi:putative oxidoreductase